MQSMTATYSPEDNKLRLYSLSRLDGETYARVKAAGFRFAPKQDLFVAPMWTPARADLLLDLCGEIGDEDTSLAERAEDRAERFTDYSDRRAEEANTAREAVDKIVEHIPFGQPILVGHHSERRARKDQARIETGIRRAISLWDTSNYWTRRAAGALRNAKYKELPEVRARRIKAIEAEQRKAQRSKDEANTFLSLWAREGLDLERALKIAGFDRVYLRDASGEQTFVSIWSALRGGKVTVEDAAAQAMAVHRATIASAERWISHHDNRLSYERAMLGEAGGLAADRFTIEVGGQVLIRDEWLTVLRVTRRGGNVVSVRTNARYVPLRKVEEITDYRAPTTEAVEKVQKATTLAPLCNFPGEDVREMTAAEWAAMPADYKSVRTEKATAERGAFRYRRAFASAGDYRLVRVFLTDKKRVDPPQAAPAAVEVVSLPVERMTQAPCAKAQDAGKASENAKFDALRETLRAGVQVVAVPQLLPTPTAIAARMVKLAGIEEGDEVLEPSFGTQRLLRAIRAYGPTCKITAVEISQALVDKAGFVCADSVICGDFLALENLGQFDRIIMNPPFANAVDIKHIERAASLLRPGGRLVAICAGGPRQTAALRPLSEKTGGLWEELPDGTFAESGTNVRTVLLTINA